MVQTLVVSGREGNERLAGGHPLGLQIVRRWSSTFCCQGVELVLVGAAQSPIGGAKWGSC